MRILIVCTGNLCRSPMAEHLMKRALARAVRIPVENLGARGWIVESAGTHAYDGLDMPENAKRALAELGITGVKHSSRLLRAAHLVAADVVFAAAKEHDESMRMLHAASAPKLRMLDEGRDVYDPMGEGLDQYRESAAHISVRVEALAAELLASAGR
ncbi:MAG: hypothetical protein K8T20_16675 [Planctomycetes bacterium]|nr:hypothetical protein [Planctomycetota bacterium]